jgi:hypothetical protein
MTTCGKGDTNIAVVIDIIAPGVQVKSTWIGPNNTETNTISGTSMGKRLSHLRDTHLLTY